MMWLGGVLVLTSVIWTVTRTWRQPLFKPVAVNPASLSGAGPRPIVVKANFPSIPTLILDEDDFETAIGLDKLAPHQPWRRREFARCGAPPRPD